VPFHTVRQNLRPAEWRIPSDATGGWDNMRRLPETESGQ
jgi:hypothetical protein